MLLPKEGMLEKVYEALKDAHPDSTSTRRSSSPNPSTTPITPRITPLLMFSDPGYVIHGVSSGRGHVSALLSLSPVL